MSAGTPNCLEEVVQSHEAIRDAKGPGEKTAGSAQSSCQLRWEWPANSVQRREPLPDTFDILAQDGLNVIGFPQ